MLIGVVGNECRQRAGKLFNNFQTSLARLHFKNDTNYTFCQSAGPANLTKHITTCINNAKPRRDLPATSTTSTTHLAPLQPSPALRPKKESEVIC